MKMLRPRVGDQPAPRLQPKVNWGQGRGGRPWERLRAAVFKRDGYLCRVCRGQGRLTPVELHGPSGGVCDHIVPLSQGGTDDMGNLQTLCRDCDKIKTQQESRGVPQG